MQHHRQAQRAELAHEGGDPRGRDYLRHRPVGVECVLRLPVSVDAGGSDAGGGHQLRGRYPFAAGQCASGGAVCGDGSAVLADCAEPGICGR